MHSAALITILGRLKLLLERLVVAHFPDLAARCWLKCLKVDLSWLFTCKFICVLCAFLIFLIKSADDCRQRCEVLNERGLCSVWVSEIIKHIIRRYIACNQSTSESTILIQTSSRVTRESTEGASCAIPDLIHSNSHYLSWNDIRGKEREMLVHD